MWWTKLVGLKRELKRRRRVKKLKKNKELLKISSEDIDPEIAKLYNEEGFWDFIYED